MNTKVFSVIAVAAVVGSSAARGGGEGDESSSRTTWKTELHRAAIRGGAAAEVVWRIEVPEQMVTDLVPSESLERCTSRFAAGGVQICSSWLSSCSLLQVKEGEMAELWIHQGATCGGALSPERVWSASDVSFGGEAPKTYERIPW